jgi:hypothetical protein
MILSDFVLTAICGNSPLNTEYFAEVVVTTTTGRLWWKKEHREKRMISRKYGENWFFVETGEFTPGHHVEALERAYTAKQRLNNSSGGTEND